MRETWQCRVAPSLGEGFAGTPAEVWGTRPYENVNDPTVFFGLYGLKDFHALWRHKGKRAILWCGSDIRHFVAGYWLDDVGSIRIDPRTLSERIEKHCDNYVENTVEYDALKTLGITAHISPSFLGNIDDYKVEYVWNKPIKYYTSVSGNDFILYGWDKIDSIAKSYPGIEFHLYGNTEKWIPGERNVFVHGRVPQEKMDSEIKKMHGAIRLTEFDGFSEVLAKSVLWGQWPCSPYIPYPYMLEHPTPLPYPNTAGRGYYLASLNQFPWNSNAKNN